MSFHNKGFWMGKGIGHLAEGDTVYENSPSRIEQKRPHQWFIDSTDSEIFPNKKQAIQSSTNKSNSSFSNPTIPPWETSSTFQSVPNQFIDRLFGSDDSDTRRKGFINSHFGNDPSVGLSISHAMDDHETCLSFGGIRKVKVNQVKDSENSFISMGQAYNREDETVTLMGHTYSRTMIANYDKGPINDDSVPMGHTYNKEDSNTLTFANYDEPDLNPLSRSVSGYDLLYGQNSVQTSEGLSEQDLDASNNANNAVVNSSQGTKTKPESASKKSEVKISKKEAPNSFPSNVRSLISTGMLDGVPVKYVSLSREELRGIIKGSGYLCGCQTCNYSKVLNAYDFERHAGCKTKHPNNHIYFENGKTIYSIVQELRSTPESSLFDAIQNITGSPINQKSFRIWKESFQAATRELQRIYGKEELNL